MEAMDKEEEGLEEKEEDEEEHGTLQYMQYLLTGLRWNNLAKKLWKRSETFLQLKSLIPSY